MCWNQVFECEYQQYITEYFDECNLAKFPVPYFPAPNDAQDACSCNLGNVVIGIVTSVNQQLVCPPNQLIQNEDESVLVPVAYACCASSGPISRYPPKNLPNNDSSLNPNFPPTVSIISARP